MTTLSAAIEAAKGGSRIHRQKWVEPTRMKRIVFEDGKLVMVKETLGKTNDGVIVGAPVASLKHAWVPSQEDVLADDWIIEIALSE